MPHNENSRVKIPALVHFTRLGYKYISLRKYEGVIDDDTNILVDVLCDAKSESLVPSTQRKRRVNLAMKKTYIQDSYLIISVNLISNSNTIECCHHSVLHVGNNKAAERRSLRLFCGKNRLFGPSDWFRTSGLVVPNHALYHLSYTRL